MKSRAVTLGAVAMAAIGIVASLAVVIPIALRLMSPVGPTTNRQLVSVGGEANSTCGHDRLIGLVVVGDVAWAPCNADPDGMPRGGIARIDPAEGIVDLRAAIPNDGPRWFDVEGALPTSDGARVAFAYRIAIPEGSGSRGGGIAIAIAEEGGFWRPPVEITDEQATLIGMGWDGDHLEVVLRTPGPSQERSLEGSIVMVRLGREGPPARTDVAIAELCGEMISCWARGAHRVTGEWRFVVSGILPEERTWLWSVSRGGVREPIGAPAFENAGMDFGASGLPLDGPLDHVGLVLDREGAWNAREALLRVTGHRETIGYYAWSEGRLAPVVWFIEQAGGNGTVRFVGRRSITIRREPGPPSWISFDNTAVALPTSGSGEQLRFGALLPRRGGGHYLVTSDGASIAVDASGERADPLGAFEHVYAVSRAAYTQLWFMLIGLPVLLVLGIGIALLVRRKAIAIATGAALGSLLFLLLTFAWAWDSVQAALP